MVRLKHNPNKLELLTGKILGGIFVFALLGLVLTGCDPKKRITSGFTSMVDPETAQISYTDTIATVGSFPEQVTSTGQTFISQRSGLDSLTLWLADASPEKKNVARIAPTFTFSLFHTPQDTLPLYQANYRLPQAGYAGSFRITFPPIFDPPGQNYYFVIQVLDGIIQVRGRGEDSYPSGQALVNEQNVPGDLAFSMTYRYDIRAASNDFLKLLTGSWLIIPLGFTLLLPGWLVLDWLNLIPRLNLWDRLTVAIGMSLAILPLMMLWSGLIGMRWSASGVKALMVFMTVLTAWRIYQRRRFLFKFKITWNDLAMALIFCLVVFLRLAMVRDMAFPAWVDSVHHALLTRLIQIQGGFPASYTPFFNIQPTAYHPGFHTGVAIFQWLSGLSLPDTLLVYGQALNVSGVLAAGLFTHSITRSRSAAIWATLAAGLLTPLPAYLTSWGRYTHLAGLIIFSTIIALTSNYDIRKPRSFLVWIRYPIVTGIALAGLILVHYRVAAFLMCWWAAELLANIGKSAFLKKIRTFGLTALFGGIFILPWIIPTLLQIILPKLAASAGVPTRFFNDFNPSLLTSAYGGLVIGIASLGLILIFFRRIRLVISLSLWVVFLFFLANLGPLGIPGGVLVNNVSVEISIYLPLCLLAGYAVPQILNWIAKFLPAHGWLITNCLAALGGTILALAGFLRLLPILNPSTVLAHSSDIPAMTWISENIPNGEILAINSFNWGTGLCAGSDGGYWIAPLTGHPTSPPPLLYAMGDSKTVLQAQASCQMIQKNAVNPKALWDHLKLNGIHYIYIGSRGGPLSPQALNTNSLFQAIYHREGTWIFKTVP